MQETSFFPVQRSLLAASALAEQVLSNYNLPGPVTCDFWHRSINDTYLVQAGNSKFMLRIAPTNWRSYENLEAEINLLQFLFNHHIIAPQPIRQKTRGHIQALNAPEGLRYAVLFSFVPGVSPYLDQPHSYRFGQAIAQFHNVTDDYPLDCAGWRFEFVDMFDEPLDHLKPWFVNHQDDFEYLLEISGRLEQSVSRLSREVATYGVCHGDVNNGNFHLIEPNDWALLDFEYFGYGWRVFDIGTFFNNQFQQLGKMEQATIVTDAFLAGYQSVRPLSQVELEVLPFFVVLHQIWLLGIGAKNLPNIGIDVFQNWAFEMCMPFIKEWIQKMW